MTAGQGGPEPPGWQPQHPGPSSQRFGPAQPPSDYPSAPPGWGVPPPQALERPLAVRAGTGAFLASTILGILSSIVTFLNYDAVVDDAIGQVVQDSGLSGSELADAEEFAESFATFGTVLGLLFTGVYLLFIWFAWNGRNWARIVLWVLGGLGIVGGLVGLATPTLGFLRGLGIFQLLLLVGAVVLLAQKPANEWYRAEKWRRSFHR